jgi:hypothetical protein
MKSANGPRSRLRSCGSTPQSYARVISGQRRNFRPYYIDGFSGPGEHLRKDTKEGVAGSPIEVLEQLNGLRDKQLISAQYDEKVGPLTVRVGGDRLNATDLMHFAYRGTIMSAKAYIALDDPTEDGRKADLQKFRDLSPAMAASTSVAAVVGQCRA